MSTFKHINDMIFIDDIEIPISIFKILEPNYNIPTGTESLMYKDGILKIRINGQTSINSGWTLGDRYISRKKDFETLLSLTRKEDSEIEKEVEKIKNPKFCRENEYPKISDLVVAMWEHIVEKKDIVSSGIKDIQYKRDEIKNKYPLKETTDGSDKVEGSTETVLPKGTRRTRNRSKHSG